MTKRKELETFKTLYNEYCHCRDFIIENNKTIYEKVSKVEDEDMYIVLKTKYYMFDGEVFAERVVRDYRSELGYKSVMFETGLENNRKFYKVNIEQELENGRVVTRYNIAQFDGQEVKRKQLSSDMFEVMSDSERNLIFKISNFKDNARHCDYLERVGLAK